MTEYYTKGIVLERLPKGELDEAVILYTKDLGKVIAVLKSSRKITSKLSGHLTVAKIVKLRLLKTNNYKIVDAISFGGAREDALVKFAGFINKMTDYEFPDLRLWRGIEYVFSNPQIMAEAEASGRAYSRFLDILGFGPKYAKCGSCEKPEVSYFYPSMLIFLCSESLKKLSINEEETIQIC